MPLITTPSQEFTQIGNSAIILKNLLQIYFRLRLLKHCNSLLFANAPEIIAKYQAKANPFMLSFEIIVGCYLL